MKILFAAYREWAIKVLPALKKHKKVKLIDHVKTQRDLELLVHGIYNGEVLQPKESYDLIILCGWSWQVSHRVLNKSLVVSNHPAYKDEYSLGTPIQNQILDGLFNTKNRVCKIGYPELWERLYSPEHEAAMSLTGNMNRITSELTTTSIMIFSKFISDFPDIRWKQWPKSENHRTPREPKDSKLEKTDFVEMTTKQLFDRIRMLEHPYPNAYIQDDLGTLFFKNVSFKPVAFKKKNDENSGT